MLWFCFFAFSWFLRNQSKEVVLTQRRKWGRAIQMSCATRRILWFKYFSPAVACFCVCFLVFVFGFCFSFAFFFFFSSPTIPWVWYWVHTSANSTLYRKLSPDIPLCFLVSFFCPTPLVSPFPLHPVFIRGTGRRIVEADAPSDQFPSAESSQQEAEFDV